MHQVLGDLGGEGRRRIQVARLAACCNYLSKKVNKNAINVLKILFSKWCRFQKVTWFSDIGLYPLSPSQINLSDL